MPEAEGSQPPSQPQGSSKGRRNHGRRGGRGGKNTTSTNGSSSVKANGGPGEGPSAATPSNNNAAENSSNREGSKSSKPPRSRRGGKQNGRGTGLKGDATARPLVQRSFGGHLTADRPDFDETTTNGAVSLSADAPEFVPGQPMAAARAYVQYL